MEAGQIYIWVGLVIWLILSVLTIIAIGRYAFILALRPYPSAKDCPIFPGLYLFDGDGDAPWLLVAFMNVIAFVGIGFFVSTFCWPIVFGFLIQSIITASRKKRGYKKL